jgi:hypothetical protein
VAHWIDSSLTFLALLRMQSIQVAEFIALSVSFFFEAKGDGYHIAGSVQYQVCAMLRPKIHLNFT